METMRKVLESMAGKMGGKQKEKWMEQCRMSLAGEVTEKDRERDTKKKEEPARPPDRNSFAGCPPEMMEQFFLEMRGSVEENGSEEAKGAKNKPERPKCCW